MKNINFKSLIVVIIIGTVGVTTVFANESIRNIVFKDAGIYFKGEAVPVSNPLALITDEATNDTKAYAPVRELFENLGYEVKYKEMDGSIDLYPKPFQEHFDPVAYQRQPMPLIGADYDEDVYLYSLSPNGAVVTYGNHSAAFDWTCLSPRLILPQIKVWDYDGDGQKDIAFSLTNGSGTYIDIDELHIVKLLNDRLIDHQYFSKNVSHDLGEKLYYNFYEKNKMIHLHLQCEKNAIDVDLSLQFPNDKDINVLNFFIYTDYLKFTFADDGKIIMNVDLCVNTKTRLTPEQVAVATAEVTFKDDKFSLSNVKISEGDVAPSFPSEQLPAKDLKFVSNAEIDKK